MYFGSKVQIYNLFFTALHVNFRERVRGKDVRVEDRVFLVTPQAPPGYDLYRSKTQENFTKQRAMTVA